MLFGTLEQDMDYLWNKFQKPIFDPATGKESDEIIEALRSFAETGDPCPVSKAKAFEFLAEEIAIEVDPHDFFPAFGCWKRWPRPMLSVIQAFQVRETAGMPALPLWGDLNKTGASNIWIDFDHSVPEWENIFRSGFPGLLKQAEEWRERHRTSGVMTEKQEAFFEGIRITYQSILKMLKRFIERAEARHEERCDFVAKSLRRLHDGPPQNFFDALQIIYLYFMFSEHMDHLQVRTLGNLDVMLTPFYENDRKNGVFTDTQMRELFDHFFMQWGSIDNYFGQPVYLGGSGADGSTQINHMSYWILEEAKKLHLTTPKIQIKIAKNTPDEFIDFAMAMIRDQQQSIVFVGEEGLRHMLTSHGFTEEDARTCYISGCYEPGVKGKIHSTATICGYINLVKPIELIFNRGRDLKTGIRLGVDVPPLSSLATFDDFYRLFIREMYWLIDSNIYIVNQFESFLDRINPANVFSATIPNSLRTGEDAFATGSDACITSLLSTGLGSLVDSLSVIEELVYEKQEISIDELADALHADWQGFERLHRRIQSFRHRYGNGIPKVDRLAAMISRSYGNHINGRPNARGGVWQASAHCASQFLVGGEKTGATPDGRFAGEELSKNASPVQGADISGVTALIRSVLSIDSASYPGDLPLDVMIHPSSVQGADGLRAWRQLMRTFFAGNGHAIQFMIFDAETLKKAQKEPEKYKNLQIRVCGWNVRFHEMDRAEQNMYIRRAEAIS